MQAECVYCGATELDATVPDLGDDAALHVGDRRVGLSIDGEDQVVKGVPRAGGGP